MTISEKINFNIKGQKDGLLIHVGDGEWSPLLASLTDHIVERKLFFAGAKVTLDVGDRLLTVSEISLTRDQFLESEITLSGMVSTNVKTSESAKNLGLETIDASKSSEPPVLPFDTVIDGEMAIMVKRTLRSGYRVVHEGHVVILGDVNPGAEIVAGGSIIVWGRLRGVVHAGADGDEDAVICALDMSPTQLRIGTFLFIPTSRRGKASPQIISINDGQLKADNWQ